MKKVVVAVVAVLALASCTKDWTCECSLNGTPVGSSTIKDKTKADAKTECESTGSVGAWTYDCEIK